METYLWLSYTRYGFEWLLRPAVMVLLVLVITSLVYPILKQRRQTKQKEVAA